MGRTNIAPVTKEHILSEIRRTAEENGGAPLGSGRFEKETGIRSADWRGRFWARWGDALREAGLDPNEFKQRFSDDAVLEKLVAEIRHFGRMPTTAELRLRRREDSSLPSPGVFWRLGSKAMLATMVADYCRERPDCADVLEALAPQLDAPPEVDAGADASAPGATGFVYLMRSGRFYKIGRTVDVGRRRYDLAIQLPEPIEELHRISTDDPVGIEEYWHKRFGDRRKNGEWFELSGADVAAFKRRKFM